MRDVARFLPLALCSLAASGCFPEYSVADGGGGGTGGAPNPVPMIHMDTQGVDFPAHFFLEPNEHEALVHFTHDFEIDEVEVSVERFNVWWEGERNTPCQQCPLDEGGPYAQMKWHDNWDTLAGLDQLEWHDDPPPPGKCSGPVPYPDEPPHKTTWQLVNETDAPGALPMTCVSWPQAAAYCASQGKRLPTLAEWLWARFRLASGWTFPWGNTPPTDCGQVTYSGDPPRCGFPKPGGETADETIDGVKDMIGSVYEWTWDAEWPGYDGGENYSGPDDPDLSTGHFRAGGSYINDANDQHLVNQIDVWMPGDHFNDAGFRCARTVK